MSEQTSSLALLIAYGNPLRCDDGAGWHVVEALAEQPGVRVIGCLQLTPELAAELAVARRVIFVDARDHCNAGEIALQVVQPQPAAPGLWHRLSPGALLELTAELYGCCPPAQLLSIGGADFGYGEGLSPVVAAALPGLLERVRRLIQPD